MRNRGGTVEDIKTGLLMSGESWILGYEDCCGNIVGIDAVPLV